MVAWTVLLALVGLLNAAFNLHRPATAQPPDRKFDAGANHVPASPTQETISTGNPNPSPTFVSSVEPAMWLSEVLARVVNGPPAEAKLRQTVHADGRQWTGIGSFVSGGNGTGQYRMQMTIHDGRGKHSVLQIGDGRLAWSRTQIRDEVVVRRVDVSRLDQWTRGQTEAAVSAGRRVGGLAEILDTVIRDFDLVLRTGRLNDQKVFVAAGTLKEERRNEWLALAGGSMPRSLRARMMRSMPLPNPTHGTL